MINKYTLSPSQELKFVKDNLETFIENNLYLSRYEDDDPKRAIAYRNFKEAYDYILNNRDIESDYKCLQHLHHMLMRDLNDGVKAELTSEQISELESMINQPTKANLEVAIDVVLYILDKRLFEDGDVRAAMLFGNKFLIDNGGGFITVAKTYKDVFREKLKEYKVNKDYDIKDWIYKYCIKGPKLDY